MIIVDAWMSLDAVDVLACKKSFIRLVPDYTTEWLTVNSLNMLINQLCILKSIKSSAFEYLYETA